MSKIHSSLKEQNPSPETLLKEQNRLQTQGKKLFESTPLESVLESAGKMTIGGSFVYGLMIYPDLDLGIVSENVTRETDAELISRLFKLDFIWKLTISDRVNFARQTPGKDPVKGYWLGLEIGFEDDVWNIDIWIQQPEWKDPAQDSYLEKLKNISDEMRIAILSIKHGLIQRGEYDSKYFSKDVYRAVLEYNVRTIDEFYTANR